MTTSRGALWLTVIALGASLAYAAGVLLPYFVNGLHHLPLAEVTSGLHDPKDMWPCTLPLGGWAHLAGVMSTAFTPVTFVFVLTAGLWGAVVTLRRGAWTVAAAHLLVVLACVAGLAWFLGPVAQALATWQLD